MNHIRIAYESHMLISMIISILQVESIEARGGGIISYGQRQPVGPN